MARPAPDSNLIPSGDLRGIFDLERVQCGACEVRSIDQRRGQMNAAQQSLASIAHPSLGSAQNALGGDAAEKSFGNKLSQAKDDGAGSKKPTGHSATSKAQNAGQRPAVAAKAGPTATAAGESPAPAVPQASSHANGVQRRSHSTNGKSAGAKTPAGRKSPSNAQRRSSGQGNPVMSRSGTDAPGVVSSPSITQTAERMMGDAPYAHTPDATSGHGVDASKFTATDLKEIPHDIFASSPVVSPLPRATSEYRIRTNPSAEGQYTSYRQYPQDPDYSSSALRNGAKADFQDSKAVLVMDNSGHVLGEGSPVHQPKSQSYGWDFAARHERGSPQDKRDTGSYRVLVDPHGNMSVFNKNPAGNWEPVKGNGRMPNFEPSFSDSVHIDDGGFKAKGQALSQALGSMVADEKHDTANARQPSHCMP
jgi:hypothetical protein